MERAGRELPSFVQPPVVEVVLSVQFEELKEFHVPHFGMVWNEVRDRFPIIEEHPPLDPTIERFGLPRKAPRGGVQLQIMQDVPFPRCGFVNREGTELIQVQRDRFVHNWRKREEAHEYPRYEHVRAVFSEEVSGFERLIDRERLGPPWPEPV